MDAKKILKSVGKFIFGTLFSIVLVFSLLVMSLANFTEFNNLSKFAGNLISGQITGASQGEIQTGLQELKDKCKTSESIEINFGGESFSLNCGEINKLDEKNIGNVIAGDLLGKIYYKQYDCDFVSCILPSSGGPQLTVLLSKKANDFFRQIQIYMWIATGIFGALFLFLTETWSNRLRNFGVTFVFVGIPFFILNYVKSLLLKSFPQEFSTVLGPLVDSLFAPVSQTYLIILIAGAVLIAASFVVKHKFERV